MERLSTIFAPTSSFYDFQILYNSSSCLLSKGVPSTVVDSLCISSLIPKTVGKASFIPTLQVRKLRYREISQFVQDDKLVNQRTKIWSNICSTPKTYILSTTLHFEELRIAFMMLKPCNSHCFLKSIVCYF